jgi:hypothetical protein
MSSKQSRKLYGSRRDVRRQRAWTRWYRQGSLDSEAGGRLRPRRLPPGPEGK